jgi:hypothetical protein
LQHARSIIQVVALECIEFDVESPVGS